MSTLTVTAKGQVTLHQDLLQHLGVQPGEKIADGVIAFEDAGSVLRHLCLLTRRR